jgi:hypothetical protein
MQSVNNEMISWVKWIHESTSVNVSGITQFDSRFSRFAKTHGRNNPNLIALLRDVTHNAPLFVRETAKSPIKTFGYASQIEGRAQGTDVYSAVNGRLLPTRSRDVITLLDTVQEEKTMTGTLESYLKIPRRVDKRSGERRAVRGLERVRTVALPAALATAEDSEERRVPCSLR